MSFDSVLCTRTHKKRPQQSFVSIRWFFLFLTNFNPPLSFLHLRLIKYCTQKCPSGWFGDACEVPGVECGNAHCFNGGACLETLNENGDTTFACDCRTADQKGNAYAGQYCEAEATATCANAPGSGNHHPNGHLFCTNNGECKTQAHLGCECPTGRQ